MSREEAPKSACHVCHRGPSEGKPIDVAPASLVFDKDKVPEKLQIKILEKEFKPADFPHQKIVAKLTKISNESSLAKVFHAGVGIKPSAPGATTKQIPLLRRQKRFRPAARVTADPSIRENWANPESWAHTIANALGVMKP